MNQVNRAYREQNKDSFSVARKAHYQKNLESMRKQKAAYVANHKSDKSVYDSIYRKQNKNKISAYKKEWEAERRESPAFKIQRNLRRRIHHVLKGTNKSASTIELIGCSIEKFIAHIESQFTDGMSWSNYGTYGWHIDHIIPCFSFDLTNEAQQRKCFNYSNQRPLWAKENLAKGKRLDTPISLAVAIPATPL